MVFSETQKFRNPFIWVILSLVFALSAYAAFSQLVLKIPFGNHPSSDSTVSLPMFIVLLVAFGFFSIRLKIEIDEKGVKYGFTLFKPTNFISWSEIQSINLLEYGFVGFGFRYDFSSGTKVYNTTGNKGILIVYKDGKKKVMIGSQKIEEIRDFLEKLKLSGVQIIDELPNTVQS